MIFKFFGHQVTNGYFHFFFLSVTAHFDEFHAVEQGTRNAVQVIGRSHKQDFRQIKIYIEVIVVKCTVLFGIEHFEQC